MYFGLADSRTVHMLLSTMASVSRGWSVDYKIESRFYKDELYIKPFRGLGGDWNCAMPTALSLEERLRSETKSRADDAIALFHESDELS
jgi:hypothetical protein